MSQQIILVSAVIVTTIFIVMFFAFTESVQSDSGTINSLPASEFARTYEKHTSALLIDIRTPEEFSQGRLPGAINIDYYNQDFVSNIKNVIGNKTAFIYCRSGNRTSHAAYLLKNAGFNVVEMEDGITSYPGKLVN